MFSNINFKIKEGNCNTIQFNSIDCIRIEEKINAVERKSGIDGERYIFCTKIRGQRRKKSC
jgi:hypothetical protein